MPAVEAVKAPARPVRAEEVRLPAGYRIEPVAAGLNYPTAVTWDDDGNLLVAESTVPFGRVAPTEIRVVRVDRDGTREMVAGPFPRLINDIACYRGMLYVSRQGAISTAADGCIRDLISGLPSWGLHENNSLAFGPDGRLYFGQGTVSNAGVVDLYALDRLRSTDRVTEHDIPGADVILTGQNYETEDMATGERRLTGAFSSWGTPTSPGQRIPGARPGRAANGAIMSANPDGSDLRVYAWGFRNPFGLAFSRDGRLYVTNNGANRVPPRAISGDPDTLWEVEEGVWYGWPDYYAGQPVTDPSFKPPDAPRHEFLIANHEELLRGRPAPPAPVASFGLHAAPTKFDFSLDPDFGYPDRAFVAEFGPLLAPPERLPPMPGIGHRVVVVDVGTGTVEDFAVNRSGLPGSLSDRGGLERPIQARFGPDGSLYIVDFGVLELGKDGWVGEAGTGTIWRVKRVSSP